jgi:hypothetical protein
MRSDGYGDWNGNLTSSGERLALIEDHRLSRRWSPERLTQFQCCCAAAATDQSPLRQDATVPDARATLKDHA